MTEQSSFFRRIWIRHVVGDAEENARRFHKGWWGGWWSRIALIVGVSGFLALGRASSLRDGLGAAMLFAAFFGSLMVLGWFSNYVELCTDGVKLSQIATVTPGGPVYSGGNVAYASVVGLTFIAPRSVHIRYRGKDWRRRPSERTAKLYLERAEEFVARLAAEVELATGEGLNIERR